MPSPHVQFRSDPETVAWVEAFGARRGLEPAEAWREVVRAGRSVLEARPPTKPKPAAKPKPKRKAEPKPPRIPLPKPDAELAAWAGAALAHARRVQPEGGDVYLARLPAELDRHRLLAAWRAGLVELVPVLRRRAADPRARDASALSYGDGEVHALRLPR